MEKEVLKERLTKLVEIGLSKNKTLDFNDVNDFFAGEICIHISGTQED